MKTNKIKVKTIEKKTKKMKSFQAEPSLYHFIVTDAALH